MTGAGVDGGSGERRRASSAREVEALIGQMFRPEEIGAAMMGYRPLPSDVIFAPFAKCGTTWLQQTFHCLRTGGDMDFEDISAVVPWIETAVGLGIDINAPQRAEPRGFKSHLSYDAVPKGARYVVSFRDPKDALVSMYRFMEGWFLEPGTEPIEGFVTAQLNDPGRARGYWRHLLSWWDQRENPNVLLFTYEHMIDDPRATVERLASFCGIELDDALLARSLEHASLDFMLRHKDRFEDPLMRRLSEARCNLPLGGDSAKVRKGGVGGYRQELSPPAIAGIDAAWAEVVAPATGFADYQTFEAAVRRLS